MATTTFNAGFTEPGTFVNVTSAGSNTNSTPFRVLIMATAQTGAPTAPQLATSASAVATAYGANSDVAEMYSRYILTDSINEVWTQAAASGSATDLNTAFALQGDTAFALFVSPFATQAAVNAFDAYIGNRWAYNEALYGFHITAKTDTESNLVALGGTLNSRYSEVFACNAGSPDTDAQKAASFASLTALRASADPALPISGMQSTVSTSGSTFTQSQRGVLFAAGLATTKENTAGQVYLDRSRTTYLTNATGTADSTYQNVETNFQLAYVSAYLVNRINSKFFGDNAKKIVTAGTRITAASNAVTTDTIVAEFIAAYADLAATFTVADVASFNANVSATYTPGTGVVAVYAPVTLAGQLEQIDVTLQFTKF